jgi:DNA-binding NtrC family response regulator
VRDCATRWNKPVGGLSDAALAMLVEARWDGNIRELRNVIERASLLADGSLVTEKELASCMPPITPAMPAAADAAPAAPAAASSPYGAPAVDPDADPPLLSTVEREHILRALQHARGNKKAAARMLGVSRRALYRRLERLGLDSTISRRSHADNGTATTPAAEEGPLDDSMPGALD